MAFADFELDVEQGELWRGSVRVKLQRQPLKVLLLLARNSGRAVTREDLRREVWGDDTHVDFDQGLGFCIRQVRSALGDSVESPTFVQTLPRLGFKFLQPVREIEIHLPHAAAPASQGAERASSARPPQVATPQQSERSRVGLKLAALVAAAAGVLTALLWRPPATSPHADLRSLAIMPFQNLSGDARQDYLAEGLSEELLDQLSRTRGLTLAGAGSVRALARSHASVREVGEAVGAAYVVEGSLRKEGSRVRITARLVQAWDGHSLWSSSYDRELTGMLELQEQIASAIVGRIWLSLPSEPPTLPKRRATSTEALDLFLRARAHLRDRTAGSLQQALEELTAAVMLAPDFAPAFVSRAEAVALLSDCSGCYGLVPSAEAYGRAKADIDEALRLEPGSARAQAVLGLVEGSLRQDYPAARRAFMRAEALDPEHVDVDALRWAAVDALERGDWREGPRLQRLLLEREPLLPVDILREVTLRLLRGHLQDETMARMIRLSERYFPDHVLLVASRAFLRRDAGELASAMKLLARGLERDPGSGILSFARSSLYIQLGAPRQAAQGLPGVLRPDRAFAAGDPAAAVAAMRQLASTHRGGSPYYPVQLSIWEGLAGNDGEVVALLEPLLQTGDLSKGDFFGCNPYVSGPAWSGNSSAALLVLAYRKQGRVAEAKRVLQGMNACARAYSENGVGGPILAGLLGMTAALEGRGSEALERLEEARRLGRLDPYLARYPFFGSLHADARWAELVARHRAAINRERADLNLGPLEP